MRLATKPKVSIIIANRNDTVMLAVTIRSVLEALKALDNPDNDVIIADNSDQHIYDSLDSFISYRYVRDGKVKIIRQPFPCLFTAREIAARVSEADYILCLDSHILTGHNMIKDLVAFMDFKASEPIGFAHAPISWAHQHESRAKHDRYMEDDELGPWGNAYSECHKITWKGMPWICKREWFLDSETGLNGYGALSQHKISWGGGDMHIGIKPWLLGYPNWAVPTSPAIHIGPFPKLDKVSGDPSSVQVSKNPYRYRLWSESGEYPTTIGFLVSCYILGGEPMMKRNEATITNRFGKYLDVKKFWDKAKELGKDEKTWLDARKILTFEELMFSKPWQSIVKN